MAEVKTFPGVTRVDAPAGSQPNPSTIEFLEKQLAKARSGYLQAIAVASVVVHQGHGVCTEEGWSPNNAYCHELAASIGDLQYRFARMRFETDHVDPTKES